MRKRLKIALVDDNDFHATLMRQTLRESDIGHEVTIFRTGAALVNELGNNKYDLVVTELVLPDTDGIELLQRIRKSRSTLPILFVTEAGSEEAAVLAMKSGAVDYISKRPGYIADLPEAVQEAHRRSQSVLRSRRRKARFRKAEKLEMVTTLVSTLNHEINNPLMAILGNVELLLKEKNVAEEKVRQKLKMVESSARRIEQITHRMENLISTSVHQTPVGPMLKLKGDGASRFRKSARTEVAK